MCAHMSVHICIFVHEHECMCARVCICCACMHIWMHIFVCMCTFVCACVCTHVCARVCTHVCVFAYALCVYVCGCAHVCTFIEHVCTCIFRVKWARQGMLTQPLKLWMESVSLLSGPLLHTIGWPSVSQRDRLSWQTSLPPKHIGWHHKWQRTFALGLQPEGQSSPERSPLLSLSFLRSSCWKFKGNLSRVDGEDSF